MDQVVEIFLQLVKSEILAAPLEDGVAKSVTPDIMTALYELSKQHDMTHTVATALEKNNLLGEDDISKKMRAGMYMAVWRDELRETELQQIYRLFEEEHIAFIPLKGAVVREVYPESWMRTSCDIDILVREDELERARDVLVSSLNYRVGKRHYHDISLYSPTNVHLELHYSIKEHVDNIDGLLEQVWNYAKSIAEGCSQHQMETEFMMFYLFAHMDYHFMHGGCGVRNFIDIWLAEKKLDYNRQQTDSYCNMCGIKVFAEHVRKLSRVWLEEEEHDELTKKLQKYIMHNGLYGNKKSSVVSRNTTIHGKGEYLLRRIFMPYGDLCISYPKLKEYPFLYSYYTVKRWTRLLNSKSVQQAMREMKVYKSITKESIQDVKELYDELGLM